MSLNLKMLDIIACPICKGKLHYDKNQQVLVCNFNKVSFPIKNGVPVMLVQEAITVTSNHSHTKNRL
jgi:uncharacterized protein